MRIVYSRYIFFEGEEEEEKKDHRGMLNKNKNKNVH